MRMRGLLERALVAVLLLLALLAVPARGQQKKKGPANKPAPDLADVKYGPYERNVLDFYKAESEKPTPLIIYIHGGGFVGGDKSSINVPMLKAGLASGISFAAIHYRFVDGEKTIFPAPQMDSVRALQFLRSKAKAWNIDPTRVACYGGSAGAGISMYIGFHDDLAKPDSPDPIERISTRISAIGTMGGQGTYDPIEIKKLIGGKAWQHPSLLKVYGLKSLDEALDPPPQIKKLYDECSAINHLTKDDPPLYMVYNEPDVPPSPNAKPGDNIHHPNFGKQLKARMDALGIENVFVNGNGKPFKEDQGLAMLAFFKRHFGTAD